MFYLTVGPGDDGDGKPVDDQASRVHKSSQLRAARQRITLAFIHVRRDFQNKYIFVLPLRASSSHVSLHEFFGIFGALSNDKWS